MSRGWEADLARWEAGTLSLDDLARRHPDVDVTSLIVLHREMATLVDAPTPDPAASWSALAASLPARERPAPKEPRRRLRRPVIAAVLAGVLGVPAVAFAATHDAVRGVVREVRELLPGGGADDDPGDDPTTTTSPLPPPAAPTTAAPPDPATADATHDDGGVGTSPPETREPDADDEVVPDADADDEAPVPEPEPQPDAVDDAPDEADDTSEPAGEPVDGELEEGLSPVETTTHADARELVDSSDPAETER